jgi:hypothetical protein
MAKTVPLEIHIRDLPQMQRFITAVAAVSTALADCDDLPEQVRTAADELRTALTGLGVSDVGPSPFTSDEDRIRDAMTEAQAHPGRTITR